MPDLRMFAELLEAIGFSLRRSENVDLVAIGRVLLRLAAELRAYDAVGVKSAAK